MVRNGNPFSSLFLLLAILHCKDTIPKIWNKYSQKRICLATVQIFTFMCLWSIYIFPQSICLFWYVDWSWEHINRSQTHECGYCEWGCAIPRKGIHKWDFRCSVLLMGYYSCGHSFCSRSFHCCCIPSIVGVPAVFNIHAVVGVSAVVGVLLLLISLRKKTKKTTVRILTIFLIFGFILFSLQVFLLVLLHLIFVVLQILTVFLPCERSEKSILFSFWSITIFASMLPSWKRAVHPCQSHSLWK